MIQRNYHNTKGILATPDHYVGLPVTLNSTDHASMVVEIGGRKIIKAGTIFPANDATAEGVLLNEIDVTDGARENSLILHGFIKVSTMPVLPSANAITALKQITFVPLMTTGVTMEVLEEVEIPVGGVGTYLATVQLIGAEFRDAATVLSNWAFTGELATAVTVTGVTLSEDKITAYIEVTAATAVAGTVTAKPNASAISIGEAPTTAVTIVTVA